MKSALKCIALLLLIGFGSRSLQAQNLSININKRYLNLPVSQVQNRGTMQFIVNDKPERSFKIRLNGNRVNGVFYSPENMTSMELTADIYVDRTSIEVFIDGGAYSYSLERKPVSGNSEGLQVWGTAIEVKTLEMYTAKSIWK